MPLFLELDLLTVLGFLSVGRSLANCISLNLHLPAGSPLAASPCCMPASTQEQGPAWRARRNMAAARPCPSSCPWDVPRGTSGKPDGQLVLTPCRYQQQLSLAVEREQTLGREKVQLGLDWQRRCDSIEQSHCQRSEDLIQGLITAREQVCAPPRHAPPLTPAGGEHHGGRVRALPRSSFKSGNSLTKQSDLQQQKLQPSVPALLPSFAVFSSLATATGQCWMSPPPARAQPRTGRPTWPQQERPGHPATLPPCRSDHKGPLWLPALCCLLPRKGWEVLSP